MTDPTSAAVARYLLADGEVVVLPGRVAAWLNRAVLDRFRRDHPELDPESKAVLVAFLAVERAWVKRQQRAEPASEIRPVMLSAKAAGDLLGITGRAVRQARERGSLNGELVSGAWIFSRAAVDKYRSKRRHSGSGRSA